MFRYSSTTVRSHASAGAGAAASTSSAGTSSGNTDGHDDSPLAYQPLAYLRLQYVLQWPMGVVISSEALSKYDRLHSFLLCHRHASKTLQELWLMHKNVGRGRGAVTIRTRMPARRGVGANVMAGADVGPAADREGSDGDGDGGDDPLFDPAGAARRMRWRQLFQHELMHFVRIVEGYLVTQVVAGCWHWLEAQVPKAQHVNELRRAHDEYLDKALCGSITT